VASRGSSSASGSSRSPRQPRTGPLSARSSGSARQPWRRSRRGTGKAEAIGPLADLLALEDSLPPGAIEPALRAAAGPGSHPLVAAQASLHLARLCDQRGDEAGARAARASLHLLTRFSVVGPFGEGRSGFSQVFAAEKEAAAPRLGIGKYRGKLGDVGWRAADALVRTARSSSTACCAPTRRARLTSSPSHTARAIRTSRSASARRGRSRSGWAEDLVHTRDAVHAPVLDQDAAPGPSAPRLEPDRRQDHRDRWSVAAPPARDRSGGRRARRGLTAARQPRGDGDRGGQRERQGEGRPVETLQATLRRRAEKSRDAEAAAGAWLDLGRYLAWAEPGDREAREAAAALEEARARRPSPTALRLLSEVARDEDERRRALEARSRSPPDSEGARAERALLLARLGDVARTSGVTTRRWAAGARRSRSTPRCWPPPSRWPRRSRARACRSSGSPASRRCPPSCAR
jgi:hypothetical protein